MSALPEIRFWEAYPDTIMTGGTECGRTLWRLQEPYRVTIDNLTICVPTNFVYDYASIPRFFWRICNPTDPRSAPAATLHDWLYAAEILTRKDADIAFKAGLIEGGHKRYMAQLMYAAVRAGGAVTYRQHTYISVMNNRRLAGITRIDRPLVIPV